MADASVSFCPVKKLISACSSAMIQNTCQKLFLFSWPYFFMNELASTFQGDVLFSNHKHKIVLNFPHLPLYTQRFSLLPLLIYIIWQEREGSVCLGLFFFSWLVGFYFSHASVVVLLKVPNIQVNCGADH